MENANLRVRNFELIVSEINSLIDTFASFFIRFKLEGYDITHDLNNFRIKIKNIQDEFIKIHKLIEGYLPINSSSSVTYNEAKYLREEVHKGDNIRKKEEEALKLLSDIKIKASLRLLNEMMEKLNTENENITKDQKGIFITVQDARCVLKNIKEYADNISKKQTEGEKAVTKIEDALYNLREIDKIKCHYENYDDMLDNTREHAHVIEIWSTYQSKKHRMKNEIDINKMKSDIDSYKGTLINLDTIIDSSNEDQFKISKLQKPKYSVKITKQKENIEKIMEYVKKNSADMISYVNQLNELHDDVIKKNGNMLDIVSSAQKYSKEFMKNEQEAMEIINNIKNELYSLNENMDITTVEKSINSMIGFYEKLKKKKLEINDIYKNMYLTKLKEIQRNCNIFNSTAKLLDNTEEIKRNLLLEGEKLLICLYDFVEESENNMFITRNEYPTESIEKTNEIYNSIESEMKILEGFKDDTRDGDYYVKESEGKILFLLDITKKILNEVEIVKNYNKSYLVEDNVKIAHDLTDNVNTMSRELKDLKDEFEKIEHEKLQKIKEKLDEINNIIEEIAEKYRIDEKVEKISKHINMRRGKSQFYTFVDDMNNEISYIKTDNEGLLDIKLLIERVLEDIKKKKDETNKIIIVISKDENLNGAFKKLDNLMNENEVIIEELNIQKEKKQKENTTNNLTINKNIKEHEESRENTELDGKKNNQDDSIYEVQEVTDGKQKNYYKILEVNNPNDLANNSVINEMKENIKHLEEVILEKEKQAYEVNGQKKRRRKID
ncbi:reticulocyte binding protein 1b [Plasmodium brasilianum]|uniref:Reticulocyte binding protein 1b n=1 Tax=Plasmodium brasilianum TaxID=5824 RepID=A0ACB9YCT6_PLABR|nr:reticulocyte binding protein 1b [Plasmodium brasilianum]